MILNLELDVVGFLTNVYFFFFLYMGILLILKGIPENSSKSLFVFS